MHCDVMCANEVAAEGGTKKVRGYIVILPLLLTTTRVYLTGQRVYFDADRDTLRCTVGVMLPL